MNPVATVRAATHPGTYTGKNRVPAILVLFLILIGIAVLRNGGKLPDQKHGFALVVMTIIVAGAAAVAPRVVFYALLAAVLVIAFSNSALISNYIDRGGAWVQTNLAGA